MDTNIKSDIRVTLRSYLQTKDDMNKLMPANIIAHRNFLRSAVIIHAFESALQELPSEVVEYAHLKYLEKGRMSNSSIASKLNVSESTLKRWDDLLIKSIITHIKLVVF